MELLAAKLNFAVSKYGVRTYRRVVQILKQNLPSDLPVSVRRLQLSSDLDGDCQRKPDRYLIRINRELAEHEAIETLLHEWAHAIAWFDDKDEHCREWGIAYAAVYRVFLREFMEKAI